MTDDVPAKMEANEEETAENGSCTMEEAAELAREWYQEILDSLEVDAEAIVSSIEHHDIQLNATGDEEAGGMVIGRKGQTLEAIQVLVSTVVAKRANRRIRVFIDAFDYRARRADALRQMALDVAGQVRESGQEALTDPLSPAERRIIHTALAEEAGINTYSEGEDPHRYVVISPAEPDEAVSLTDSGEMPSE